MNKINLDNEEAREFIEKIFLGYKNRKQNGTLYERDSLIPKNIIMSYYHFVDKPNFNVLIDNYKNIYVYNESRVETNITDEEQKGLETIYDFLNDFDFNKDNFNIFITSMIIHQKLYSHCLAASFGGELRSDTALLFDSNYEVPSPIEAQKIFQAYILNTNDVIKKLDEGNIFDYIDGCIKITTELIGAQPYSDGNKRTFRTLLNLMFKRKNLPPVYITVEERDEYKSALLKALIDKDYTDLNQFYYYKICDSIYELDVYPRICSKEKTTSEGVTK